MTALAADRNTTRAGRQLGDSPAKMGVKAATKIYQGAAVVNDAGVAAPARTAASLITLGVARKPYDNTAGAANDIVGEYDMGDFFFANSSAGDAIAAADIGNDCYWVDDATVAKTSNSAARSRAGKIIDVVASEGTYQVLVRVGVGI
jgi:hypothetical protein